MKKMILFSFIVFILSVAKLRDIVLEQWTIEDRFWEPDGSNLMQDRLDTLDIFAGIAILGCIASLFIPIIGFYCFFRKQQK